MDNPEVTAFISEALRQPYVTEQDLLNAVIAELRRQPVRELQDAPPDSFDVGSEAGLRRALLKATLSLAIRAQAEGQTEVTILCRVMHLLLRRDLGLDRDILSQLLDFVGGFETLDLKVVPVQGVIGAIERATLTEGLAPGWQERLTAIADLLRRSAAAGKGPAAALLARIEKLCSDSVLRRFTPDEGWSDQMVADVAALPAAAQKRWEALLQHCATVSPEPPAPAWEVTWDEVGDILDPTAHRRFMERVLDRRCSTTWQARAKQLIADIGEVDFRARVTKWLDLVPRSKPGHLSRESLNREVLRGLLWCLPDATHAATIGAIAAAAEFFFKKNSPLGTACVTILARVGTSDALTQLTVLSGRVKATSHKSLIQVARERVAAHLKISIDELDDVSIPTSGFTELGHRKAVLAGFTAEISIAGLSANLRWFKPNGQPQASVPAAVKREHADELKDLQRAVKEAETTLASVAARFEAAPLAQRSWSIDHWKSRYLEHPIAGTMVRRLLWELSGSASRRVAAWEGSGFVDAEGRAAGGSDQTRIALWHPVRSLPAEIAAWRTRLEERGITQPFKQAHREIYLLTDAERETHVYSNRFASHILRQSQFRALAKARGWSAGYLGPWDSGGDGIVKRELPRWNLRAEFWVNAAGEEYAEAGGYFYVATDQVRFYQLENLQEPLPLSEVPPLVLSEVLRDVDLFVGVGSVGNDPTWQDGGPEGRYRAYWQDYSFGPLSETATTRKAVLERLIPRMKIAERCRLDGRFLIVRGDLRTYKIHLGSSNILMEPNDQYLCIVADRRSTTDHNQLLFLPFEGDRTLSLILSKALLLADDTRITDPTIVSQICRSRQKPSTD
jgi:hypothetical protein